MKETISEGAPVNMAVLPVDNGQLAIRKGARDKKKLGTENLAIEAIRYSFSAFMVYVPEAKKIPVPDLVLMPFSFYAINIGAYVDLLVLSHICKNFFTRFGIPSRELVPLNVFRDEQPVKIGIPSAEIKDYIQGTE